MTALLIVLAGWSVLIWITPFWIVRAVMTIIALMWVLQYSQL
jgi:hypothetical protein